MYRAMLSSESHAPVANTQPVSPRELPFERFDIALAGFGITRKSRKNAHRGLALDMTKFSPRARVPNET